MNEIEQTLIVFIAFAGGLLIGMLIHLSKRKPRFKYKPRRTDKEIAALRAKTGGMRASEWRNLTDEEKNSESVTIHSPKTGTTRTVYRSLINTHGE